MTEALTLDLSSVPTVYVILVTAVIIAVGITKCFHGYRLFDFTFNTIISIIALLSAYPFAVSLVEGGVNVVIVLFLFSLAFGILMVGLYLAGSFITGMIFGALLCYLVWYPITCRYPGYLEFGIFAVSTGIITVFLKKCITIIITAFSGSIILTASASLYIAYHKDPIISISQPLNNIIAIIAVIVIGVSGTLIQFFHTCIDEETQTPRSPNTKADKVLKYQRINKTENKKQLRNRQEV